MTVRQSEFKVNMTARLCERQRDNGASGPIDRSTHTLGVLDISGVDRLSEMSFGTGTNKMLTNLISVL